MLDYNRNGCKLSLPAQATLNPLHERMLRCTQQYLHPMPAIPIEKGFKLHPLIRRAAFRMGNRPCRALWQLSQNYAHKHQPAT